MTKEEREKTQKIWNKNNKKRRKLEKWQKQ